MYTRVYLEITNICNKSCSFCPKNRRVPHSMTMEEFDLAVRSIAPVTDYLYYHVMGEPLLHPLLPTFIRRAAELGLKSAVTTNGTLLPDRGRELIESGVYKVNVSVHSFEDGSDEEYADYLNGCLDFADEASRSGVLTVLRLWNKGVSDTKNSETESAIFARFGEPESVSARGARIRDKLHLEYGDRFIWPDCEAAELGEKVYCHGLHDHFGVLSDGSVIPCCLDHEGDMTLGNIFRTPLEEILSGDRAVRIRSGFEKKTAVEELCRKCAYARRFKI